MERGIFLDRIRDIGNPVEHRSVLLKDTEMVWRECRNDSDKEQGGADMEHSAGYGMEMEQFCFLLHQKWSTFRKYWKVGLHIITVN